MTARPAPLTRVVAAVFVLALVGACGSGDNDGRAGTAADTTVAGGSTETTVAPEQRSAARWETVATYNGTGAPASPPSFDILAGAIQWRARWSCEGGTLKAETVPPPRRPGALIDATCPKEGEGFSIVTGPVRLNVQATGAWKIVVDQQIDVPLNEPPLPAMANARVLGQGDFYNVEKTGRGTARLYQLPDGQRALRFENLYVNENTDLFVWLNEAVQPKTSQDVVSKQYWSLGNLKSTVGSQNYILPANIPIDRVRSIVIWCQPVAIAYAAAGLNR